MQREIIHETEHSSLWCIPNFPVSDELETSLTTLPLLEKPTILVVGKEVHQQRDVGFFSDTSEGYYYSKKLMKSQPLTPELRDIMQSVNEELGTEFNGILVNRYNSGADYIGAHSDSESGLDPNNKTVASLSFGATRIFRISRTEDKKKIKVVDYEHTPYTLLVMDGEFQSEFKHEIPKQLRIKQARISLTFRTHRV